MPDVHVATGPAYAALAAARRAAPPPTRPRSGSATLRCGEALQRRDFAGVLATLTNDFEPVVRAAYPAVDAALRALDAAGAPGRAMLSGSGGACFALCRDARSGAARSRRASKHPSRRRSASSRSRGGTHVALDAIVLAGGGPDAVSALEPGAPNKAFVRVGGIPFVQRTIVGLRGSSRIDRIVAVAPPSAAAHPALANASEVRGDGAGCSKACARGWPGSPRMRS